jgi:hypothetical protein
MGRHFAEIAFTPAVQAEQTRIGSRRAYARMAEAGREDDRLGPAEVAFIGARESFYLATVSSTGWPYIQHRGGPPGFVRALDVRTLGFADFGGNRQHISVGNLADDARVSLFFMDYAAGRRLKLFGRARVTEEAAVLGLLAMPDYPARVERAVLIEVAGHDWNCPQHIPRLVPAA